MSAGTSTSLVRVWIDATGRYTTVGEFVDFRRDVVVLRKQDGSLVRLPMARLSEFDRRYVRSKKPNPPDQS